MPSKELEDIYVYPNNNIHVYTLYVIYVSM